jgi:hydroxymethylglutaryl-CoA synthase
VSNERGVGYNMLEVGIDAMSFYTSRYYLDLRTLAIARLVDPERFCSELGQKQMSLIPPCEDVVTLAVNAAINLRDAGAGNDLSSVDLLLFATESGVDFSKSAGMYVHQLLNLSPYCRVVELKQACYAATAGLRLAMSALRDGSAKKVLLVASDIAHYELNTAAESSQGNGAVAMLLSANPRVLVIERECGFCSRECMDFWRPNYRESPFVDGRLSCDIYLRLLEESWLQYTKCSGRGFSAHDIFGYHTPVPKLVETAHRRLAKINGGALSPQESAKQLEAFLHYNRLIGNSYTASLYVGIISLLENSSQDLAGCRLGLYSYGSGSVGEYFSAVVQDGYRDVLLPEHHRSLLEQRKALTYDEYVEFYNFRIPAGVPDFAVPEFPSGKCRLKGIEQHKRRYVLSEK